MKKTNNESIDFANYLSENYTYIHSSDVYKMKTNSILSYTIEEVYKHFIEEYRKVKYVFQLEVEVDKELDEEGLSNLCGQFAAFRDYEFYDGGDETCNVLNYNWQQIK